MKRICKYCKHHYTDSINDIAWCACDLNREEHSESGCDFYTDGEETDCPDFGMSGTI